MLTTGRLALFFLLFNEKYLELLGFYIVVLGRFESHVVFSFVNGKGQAGFYSISSFLYFLYRAFLYFLASSKS